MGSLHSRNVRTYRRPRGFRQQLYRHRFRAGSTILFRPNRFFFARLGPCTMWTLHSQAGLVLQPRRDVEDRTEIRNGMWKGSVMLSWVVTFLIIALIAGILGFGGLPGRFDRNRQNHLLHCGRAVPGVGHRWPRARTHPRLTPRLLPLRGHPDRSADALGSGDSSVCACNRLDPGTDVGRERRSLSRTHVDVDSHIFRRG